MLDAPGEPIELPHDYGVQLVTLRIVHEPIQLRAGSLGPAHPFVDVLPDDYRIRPPSTELPKLYQLHVNALVGCADAGIDTDSFHVQPHPPGPKLPKG